MQISSLDKCCKPRRYTSFSGAENSAETSSNVGKRTRYKRFEQLSDEALGLRSAIKAHDEVSQSGKMHLYRALPAIAAGLIGTSIAITQPGKLSAKAGAGLGFLAIAKAVSLGTEYMLNKCNNKNSQIKRTPENEENSSKKAASILAAGAVIATSAAVGIKYGSKIIDKVAKPVSDFLKKDSKKLADEINSSKLGTFVDKSLNPFIAKHQKAANVAGWLAPLGIVGGAINAHGALAQSLSNDIEVKTKENFIKGKIIQQIARENFEKIDAVDVSD